MYSRKLIQMDYVNVFCLTAFSCTIIFPFFLFFLFLVLPRDEKQLFTFIRKQTFSEGLTSDAGRLYIAINKELVKL